MNKETAELLRELAGRYETASFIQGDPSWWMHQVRGAKNQETTAFIASVLSYGSRAQFMPKIGLLLESAGGDMERWVRTGEYRKLFAIGDKRSFYRLYTNDTMRRFLDAYSLLLNEHGSMGEYLRGCGVATGIEAVEKICAWFSGCDISVVVPKDTTSACKRVCMFLRWMVRRNSPVDLGLWGEFIDCKSLVIPLDTHVLSESINLGLIASRTASMSTARRLTATLAEIFPEDPLRGDFALFGYGVNH